jgi:histidyl-tRNA synthetase
MIQSLPGFRDFYPEQMAARNYLFAKWRETARRYGFREYDGPPLEPLELYTVKSGQEIVGQLYHFVDKGNRPVALRPEMTPTLARMVAARQRQFKKPLKWFAIPQLFRYERQQKGRLREHFQLNCDIIGEPGVAADAELVACLIDSLRALGLTAQDFVVRVSDRLLWREFLNAIGVVETSHDAVFAVVDKIERLPQEVSRANFAKAGLSAQQIEKVFLLATADAEKILASAGVGARLGEFTQFQRALDGFGLWRDFAKVDFSIVRGLAYYTGIVFEVHDREGKFRAIAGGGRYDNLLKLVSGGKVDLAALGFGMGDVVLTELLRERGRLNDVPDFTARFEGLTHNIDGYVVIVDESLRGAALGLIHHLRDAGFSIDYALSPAKVGKQFENASSLGARWAIVVAPQEWQSGQVKLKNMASGQEEVVPAGGVVQRLK